MKTAVKVHLSHGQDIRLVPYKLNIYGKQTAEAADITGAASGL